MKSIAILEGHTIDAGQKENEFFEAFGHVESYEHTAASTLLERLQNVDYAFIDGQQISASIMDRCPNLKYIGIMATGTDCVDLTAAAQRNIAVTNVPSYASPSVAQHGFSLILYLMNRVDLHIERNRTGFWALGKNDSFWDLPQTELAGKTLGISGFGPIGKQMASIGSGFGMRVLISTEHPAETISWSSLSFTDLNTMLAQSDIVSLHKPLNERTKCMINQDTLSLMKNDAVLINTARGGLIDEKALAEALGSGKLKAAALDVLTQEPPSPQNPLLGLPNCYITPHRAWVSPEARERLWTAVTANFTTWLRNSVPPIPSA